jgi:hypothetical protein
MYCEYFKLYKIITEYVYENINDKKITEIIKVNNFPVYKDLEPFKEYSFETTTEIHENILVIVNSIISNLNTRENELNLHRGKQAIGLNIDNFITSYNFELTVIKEKISMFLTYIEFFHNLHTKHLKRFSNKIQLMYTHINTDIRFDENIEMNKDKKQDLTSDLSSNNEINLTVEEIESNYVNNISNNIITDEDSVKLINDIIENKNEITPIYENSKHITMINEETHITDENVYNNFKNISQSCDNLLSKDTNDNKSIPEVSDISDDISVMSEIIMDEPENTNTTKTDIEQPKPKRGRKKKN